MKVQCYLLFTRAKNQKRINLSCGQCSDGFCLSFLFCSFLFWFKSLRRISAVSDSTVRERYIFFSRTFPYVRLRLGLCETDLEGCKLESQKALFFHSSEQDLYLFFASRHLQFTWTNSTCQMERMLLMASTQTPVLCWQRSLELLAIHTVAHLKPLTRWYFLLLTIKSQQEPIIKTNFSPRLYIITTLKYYHGAIYMIEIEYLYSYSIRFANGFISQMGSVYDPIMSVLHSYPISKNCANFQSAATFSCYTV